MSGTNLFPSKIVSRQILLVDSTLANFNSNLPLLILVSRRGGLGEYNSMIHTFCEHVEEISNAARFRSFSLDGTVPLDEWSRRIVDAYEFAQITHRPVLMYLNLMRE